jgi:hypothetical protein
VLDAPKVELNLLAGRDRGWSVFGRSNYWVMDAAIDTQYPFASCIASSTGYDDCSCCALL